MFLRILLAALFLVVPATAAHAVNVWIHPAYDTLNQIVLSGAGVTFTRASGPNATENLPIITDLTIANGAALIVVSATFDVSGGAGDSLLFGVCNPSQGQAVSNYPGDSVNSYAMQSDGGAYTGNATVGAQAISGGFAAGDQVDVEVDRAGGNTIRFRKVHLGTPGAWTPTASLAGLGSGTFTVCGTSYYGPGDQMTLVGVTTGGGGGGGGGGVAPQLLTMGIGK